MLDWRRALPQRPSGGATASNGLSGNGGRSRGRRIATCSREQPRDLRTFAIHGRQMDEKSDLFRESSISRSGTVTQF